MVSFSWPGFLISAVIILAGIWGFRAERKFLSYLRPEDRLWGYTIGTLINLFLLFFCVVFTFGLYATKQMFSMLLASFIVFLLLLPVYFGLRWRATLKLFGSEAREGLDSLRDELLQLSRGRGEGGSASSRDSANSAKSAGNPRKGGQS